MSKKLLFTTYLAGYIEADASGGKAWRDRIVEKFETYTSLGIYDPIAREAQKTGKPAGEHVDYVIGLKKSGQYKKFMDEMNKIWLGNIHPTHDLIETFKLLRYRKIIDGNELRDLDSFGDYEAVIRSDFIIAYIKKDVSTVGTLMEIFLAMLFKIPVYLITDVPKTETNSSLIMMVIYSGGEIFYKTNDCINFIKNKYKLNKKNY